MVWIILALFALLLIVLVIFGFSYFRKSELSAHDNVSEVAKNLALTFTRGSLRNEPFLKGTYRKSPVKIQSVVTSSGATLIYTTNYTVTLNGTHVPQDLVVYPEGILAKIGKVFGGEDIQLNDPVLDESFIIKGSSEDDARLFFECDTIKSCFLKIVRDHDNFRLENKTLIFEFPYRLIETADKLQTDLDTIMDYVDTINNSPGKSTDLLDESTTLEVPLEEQMS